MIGLDVDFDIEELIIKYKRIGLFMPRVIFEYNNSLAFNTRAIAKRNLKARTVQRTASSKWLTSRRVLTVKKAKFQRQGARIEGPEVGGLIVPSARDPEFMARLEFGGQIPQNEFGQVGIPTVKGARRGNLSGNLPASLSVPRLAAQAVSSRNVKGSLRKKRAVALAIANRERKKTVKFKDNRGRESLYRVKGKGRGKKRAVSNVTKIWTLTKARKSTTALNWLSDATDTAMSNREKTFIRIAEKKIGKDLLAGKRFR
jgi:hypothetical protein